VLLGLPEDKSPFMPAMPPWGTEQSRRHSTEPERDTAPGPPTRWAELPTPMYLQALARGVPCGPESEHPLTQSISVASHQGHRACLLALRGAAGRGETSGVGARAAAHGESIPKAPGTAQRADGSSPPPAAGSPPTDGQTDGATDAGMDRGMDGSPQPCAQPQPPRGPAAVSGLAEGPWPGLGKVRVSGAARCRDAERGTARLPADSSAQMFQQGLSALATGEVERGTASRGCLRAWVCACSPWHGRPPTACAQGTPTRSPLSAARRGEPGPALATLLARPALGAAPHAWQPTRLLGPSSPGRVPDQTVRPAARGGTGDAQSRGESGEDGNGAGQMGQAKLPTPAPQTTALPAGPPLAQRLPANPT